MKKLAVVMITLILLVGNISIANAGIFGGSWANNPTYWVNPSSPYYSDFNQAINNWNGALSYIGASIRFTYDTAEYASFIPEMTFYGETGWNGYGQAFPNQYSGTLTYATLKLNRTYMDNYTPEKRKAITTHELGHILGLSHNTYTSPHTLMYEGGSSVYYDQWGISSPQGNDIADLNLIY
jgi:predicted Zn-dependent protease